VIDIGLLRTTLMEIGTWVSKDLYSGRIVRIPNSVVLKGPVFNYTQGFAFIWDEIKVLFTTNSDCQLAREMLLRVANVAIGEYVVEARTSWKAVSYNFRSANQALDPTVTLVVNAGSLEFTVDYVVDYTRRSAMKDRLFTKIVEEVANSNGKLEWAASGVTVINQLETGDALGARPPSSIRGAAAADSH
jgi:small-conductance mechanosensitive channel